MACCCDCNNFDKKLKGFLTDREQRKIMGMGILYILGFPILILMIVIGAIKASPPGEENPNCPAEPNMPWFLVTGGAGIAFLLLIRIILNKLMRCIKNNQKMCDDVAGCFCEFGCNLIYDITVIVAIVLWMITVTWWVFRHMIGPDTLYSILGKEGLDNFRSSLGDNDTIHLIQFDSPDKTDYCDHTLYMVTFVLLCLGWIVLIGALIVFIIDKILNKIVCCRLCSNITNDDVSVDDEEHLRLNADSLDNTRSFVL